MKQKIKKSNNLSEKQEDVSFIILTYNILIKYFQKSKLFFSAWKYIQNKSFNFFINNFKIFANKPKSNDSVFVYV